MIQLEHMREILKEDFYTIQDVKRLYKREFPNADESLINPYTLKTLDFRVYAGYIVRKTYTSAVDYFRALLTTIAVFKIKSHIHMNETTLNSQKGKHSERRVESHSEEHPVTLP